LDLGAYLIFGACDLGFAQCLCALVADVVFANKNPEP
jgi:hypothetical protein